jgi:hypothetical protein
MITDVAVDPAGNVWGSEQLECHRTGGRQGSDFSHRGGSGLSIIYEVAAPVNNSAPGPADVPDYDGR